MTTETVNWAEIKHTGMQPFLLPVQEHYDQRGGHLKTLGLVKGVYNLNEYTSKYQVESYPVKEVFYTDSKAHVVRGLHYQVGRPQSKLLTLLRGAVILQAVCLTGQNRGCVYQYHLTAEHLPTLFIPSNYALGYCVEEDALMEYQCDNLYHPEGDRAIHYTSISWPVDLNSVIVSEKDNQAIKVNFSDAGNHQV